MLARFDYFGDIVSRHIVEDSVKEHGHGQSACRNCGRDHLTAFNGDTALDTRLQSLKQRKFYVRGTTAKV